MTAGSTTSATDDLQAVRRVADAVLYEGYLLYPYRASSSKNQVRWQFGVVGPAGAADAGVGEESSVHTECLLDVTDNAATVDIHLRFLHTQWRAVERAEAGGTFSPVDELRVGGAEWISWHEAVEQERVVGGLRLSELGSGHAAEVTVPEVTVPGAEEVELLRDDAGAVVGRLVRTRWPLSARLDVAATPAAGSDTLRVLRVTVTNTVPWSVDERGDDAGEARGAARDVASRSSLVGAHLVMRASGASFLSTVDPPESVPGAAAAARACTNSRCWPVLAGVHDAEGAQTSDMVLAAPIILYDHPAIAEESPGELYDSTEIDEILTLRVMTMTDEEKLAARGTDPRAGAIIDRCDGMPPEVFERMHGALRGYDSAAGATGSDAVPSFDAAAGFAAAPNFDNSSFDNSSFDNSSFDNSSFDDSEIPTYGGDATWFTEAADSSVAPETDSVLVGGVALAKGSRVLLRPRRRADAHDMFLANRTAVVARIDLDVDGVTHVAVLLEDDPASDLHDWYGRYYYFATDEIEPLAVGGSSAAGMP